MTIDEIKKEEKINLTIEFVDNGVILEFLDDCMKHVVEGCDKEPYHAIADDIQGAMSGMVVGNKYQIEIKITAL